MISKAKKLLKDEGLTCVLITPNDTKKFNSKGIKHLLDWHIENPDVFNDGIIADSVIGLAASSILVCGGIKEVYGDIMSQSAVRLLEENSITFSYGKLVERIMNRDNSDICPMEKTCIGTTTPEEALIALKTKIYGA